MLKPPGHNLGHRRHAACKHTGLTRLLRMPALSRHWRPSLSWRTSTTSNTTACSAPVRVPAGGDTLIALCGASAGHPPGTLSRLCNVAVSAEPGEGLEKWSLACITRGVLRGSSSFLYVHAA